MMLKSTRWLAAAVCLAAASLAPAAPLETSVPLAQAMLVHEDLGRGIHVFRAPQALEYWTSTNTVVVVNDEEVNVDAIGLAYTPGSPLDEDFPLWVSTFAKKAMQEALDGAVSER